jgi:carbonic anhydrase
MKTVSSASIFSGGGDSSNLNRMEPNDPPPVRRAVIAEEALALLLSGNERFLQGKPLGPRRNPAAFRQAAAAQFPFAAVVTCADSRVAPEILFDVGVGDIFVVRVAGNVISGSGVPVRGSIEFAAAELEVPLVLVLGHSQCGAVKAAMRHIDAHDALTGALKGLVALIRPAVARSRKLPGDPLENAISANVAVGVERLKVEPVLAPLVQAGTLQVVGAVYDLQTGKVSMLDQSPAK